MESTSEASEQSCGPDSTTELETTPAAGSAVDVDVPNPTVDAVSVSSESAVMQAAASSVILPTIPTNQSDAQGNKDPVQTIQTPTSPAADSEALTSTGELSEISHAVTIPDIPDAPIKKESQDLGVNSGEVSNASGVSTQIADMEKIEGNETGAATKKKRDIPDIDNTDDLIGWLSGINKDLASFVKNRDQEKKERKAESEKEEKGNVSTDSKEESVSVSPDQAADLGDLPADSDKIAGTKEEAGVTYPEVAEPNGQEEEISFKRAPVPDVTDKAAFNAWMENISSNIAKVNEKSIFDKEEFEREHPAPAKVNSDEVQALIKTSNKTATLAGGKAADEKKKLPDISNKLELNAWLAGITKDIENLTAKTNDIPPEAAVTSPGVSCEKKPIMKKEAEKDLKPVDKKVAHVTFAFKTNDGGEGAESSDPPEAGADSLDLEITRGNNEQGCQKTGAAAAVDPQVMVDPLADVAQSLRVGECSLEHVLDSISCLETDMLDAVSDFAKLSGKLQRMSKNLQKVKRSTEELLVRQVEDVENFNELD